jgi:hypothetical protein
VGAHGGLRRGAVAGQHGGDHGLVLGEDLAQRAAAGGGRRAEQGGGRAQLGDDGGGPGVAGGAQQQVVQRAVGRPERRLVTARGGRRHRREGGADGGVVLPGAVQGGLAGGGRLEGETDLDDLPDVVRAGRGDAEAAVALDDHQARLGEAQHALADRAAGHAEQVGELIDGVGPPGHELAGGDAVADRLGDGVGEGGGLRRQAQRRHE